MKKISRCLVAVLIVFLLFGILATPVLAFDVRTATNVTVPAGEVVDGDLYVIGSTIVIDGTVRGDIFSAAQELTVNGNVDGGVTFAGGTLTINGDIGGGVRLAGQNIVLSGNIGRDLVAAGGDVTIDSEGTIEGDLVMAVGSANIGGSLSGDVKGGVGTVTLSGIVAGNVNIQVDRLTVASSADIQGDLTYSSQNQAIIQSGARIGGTTTYNQRERVERSWERFFPVVAGIAVVWQVLSYLMILVLGIIIIVIASRRMNFMANAIQRSPWHSLGWGAVILIVTPIAAFIVMFTVIGIPLSLITLALYAIALYLSQVPVALLIGRLIIKQNRPIQSKGLMIGALALGLFILLLLRLIPVFGWVIAIATVLFGLGALVMMNTKRAVE